MHLWSPPLAELQKEHSITLNPEEHHHFYRVLRGKEHQQVVLMDGHGYTVEAQCTETSKRESQFTLLKAPLLHQQKASIHILGPIPKGKRFPYLMEKLQEMGVKSYAPLQTEHSIREDWSNETRKKMNDRLVEACKQSRCPYLMELKEARRLDDWKGITPPLVLDIEAAPLLQTDMTLHSEMIFGPEAGWSQGERGMFQESNWPRASLNHQHLRMETAALLGAGTALQMKAL